MKNTEAPDSKGGEQNASQDRAVGRYLRRDLRRDVVAGLTVAITGVPQTMAYALIAGLPPVIGLYTAVVSGFVGALFGSSRHLITGPTNATCMVLFSIAAPYMQLGAGHQIEVILFITLLAGIIKITFGLLNLGGVVRYVSNSVVVGFTAGAGILIAGNQLKNVLGIEVPAAYAGQFYQVLIATAQRVGETNPYSLTVAVLSAAIFFFTPRLDRRIPAAIVAIGVSSALVYLLGWNEQGVAILKDITEIKRQVVVYHFPRFLHPSEFSFDLLHRLGGGAVAVAILGLVESASSSRAVAASSGQRVAFSREFIGQGLANVAGAFFMNLTSSGSFVRSAINYQAGARTRCAAMAAAVSTALIVVVFAPLANYIPTASLAGMLIVVAATMVQRHRLSLALRSGGNSRRVLVATLAATLVLPLHYAIFVGVFLSIVFLLKITSRADLTLLVPTADGSFDEVPFEKARPTRLVLINLEGDLYFAAVENLDYELQQVLTPETRVVVLRMKRLRAVGSTAMAILEHFWSRLRERGVYLVVCGVEKDLEGTMTRSGLRAKIGEQNIFYADNTLFRSTELALARARGILDMERRRAETEHPEPVDALTTTGVEAGSLMARRVVRFGEGHSVREAVWLLSEMYRRGEEQEAEALFLQDTKGRLSGVLTPWKLLAVLLGDLTEEDARSLSSEDFAARLRNHFAEGILNLADRKMPDLKPASTLVDLLRAWDQSPMQSLPVRDDSGRIVGHVRQHDLLEAIGKVMHLEAQAEAESQEDYARGGGLSGTGDVGIPTL